ncbi:MAG TPA: hypothetical protein VN756_08910, partial [Solirubrobacterales bacterium]|nr:hypothetical protein [Solirubrobacterales bacterium]
MARNFEDLGGIGVRIVADASQIKKDFDRELSGFKSQPVKIPVTFDDGGKLAELRKSLSGLEVTVKVKTNRDSARSLRRDIQTRVEQDGGVLIPVKIKDFTHAEAAQIRESIINSIGTISIPISLNWGEGGPPGAAGFGGGGGGPQGYYWRPRAAGPTGAATAPRETDLGPLEGGNILANPNEAGRPARGRGSGRRRSTLRQLEGESEAEHLGRLQQMYAEAEQKFAAAEQGSREATLAYNRMVDIRKRTGQEGPTARLPVARKGEESTYPLRTDISGNVVRGGPKVGPLVGEAASSRRRVPAPAEGMTDAELAQTLRERFGIEFDESGAVVAIGQGAPRASAIERRADQRAAAAVREGRGFRGQRATRAPFGEGLDLTPEQVEQRRAANAAAVESALQASPVWKQFVSGLQKGEGGRFINKEQRGQKYRDILGPAFAQGAEQLEAGEIGDALRTVTARRTELLAGAFAKKGGIPGVGPGTAKRYLDPKRDDTYEKTSPEQLQWIEEMRGLDAIRGEISARIQRLQAEGRRSQGGQDAAATRRGETTGRPLTAERVGTTGGTQPRPVFYESPMSRTEAAAAHARWRASMQYEPVVPPVEPETITAPVEQAMAAGGAVPPAVPPGTVNMGAGGGEGEWVPFGGGGGGGGGGGPVPVTVQNWPAWMTEGGSRAAGPIGPALSDQGTLSAEEMARQVEEHEATVGPIVPQRGRRRKAAAVKEPAPPKGPAFQRPTQQPSAIAGRLGAAGLLSEEEAEGILFPIGRAPSGIDIARQQVEAQLAEARQGLPIRGAPVSVAQLVAGPARGAATARFQQAGQLLSQASDIEKQQEKLTKNYQLQETALNKITKLQAQGVTLTKQQSAELENIPDELADIGTRLTANADEQDKLVKQASNLAKLTTGEKLTNLGKSFAGSLAGLTVFSGALAGTTAVLGAAGVALGDYLERSSGYLLATQQITGALSDQTKASGGAVKQTVAQTAAQANLTYEQYQSVKANLEQRASVEASNKAFDEQLKIVAAERNVEAGQREIGGRRFDQGLFQTTGGLLGTPLLGTPSTGELLGREIQALTQGLKGGYQPNASGRGAATFPGANATRGGDLDDRIKEYTDRLGDLNDRFEGTGLKFVAASDKNADASAQVVDAFEQAGFGDIAQQIKQGNIAVPQGTNLDPRALATAVSIAAERNERPDPRVLLSALEERILPAVQFGIQNNLKNTLETFLPAQRGLQFLAQPQAPFGRGLVPLNDQGQLDQGGVTGLQVEGKTQFSGVPQSAVQSFREYEQEASAALDAINAKAAEGERVLADKLGVPESVIGELRGLGERIGEINQQQADIRLDLQMSQYNRQLFLAKRTLGDLAGLTGREGGTFIGQLQRQDLLLSRRSQLLSLQSNQLSLQTSELQQQSGELGQQQSILQLELAQRRVNFQRAVAGFTAPGTTPEERAARIEEAKIEADYAQREIDFQRQQVGIQGQVLKINREQLGIQQQQAALAAQQYANTVALQDALNNRAYEDQAAAIAELQKAFESAQQLQALENLKSLITTQRDLLVQEMEAQVAAEEEFIKAQGQFAQDIMSQTGEFVQTVVDDVATVFTRVSRAFAQSGLGRFLGYNEPSGSTGPTTRDTTRERESTNSGGAAAGFLGQIQGPTQITVGEAGTET